MKKRILALFLVVVMCLGLAACGNKTVGGDETDKQDEVQTTDGYLKDTVTVALSADGGTFDPFTLSNWGTAAMTTLIYQGLLSMDYDYNLYYGIAKEIEQVDDLNWKLVIWDCVYDTDGHQITIDDVIWSYDMVIKSGNLGAIPKFDHFEKEDEYTAVMVLKEPFDDGDFEKHFGNATIIDQETYESYGDMTTNPVGTGPYKLADYTVNSEVVLEVNEDFWMNNLEDVDNPMVAQNFKTIKYEIIQDASSRAIALEMGTVDIVDSMDAADVQNMVDNPDISIIDMPQRPPVAFALNANEQSVCSSKELRQAICYALDNQAIADALGVPAEAVYGLQPNMLDAPEEWSTGREYYDFDQDKAKELIAASGYNGETVTLMYVSSTTNDATAIMMQSQLNEVGINVKLFSVDQITGMDYKYDPSKWDIRLDTMGGGVYLSQVIKAWWSEDIKDFMARSPEKAGWNSSLVVDTKLDELYVAVKNEASDENISAWDEYFNEQGYAYAICSYSTQTACSSELQCGLLTTNGGLQTNTFTLAK